MTPEHSISKTRLAPSGRSRVALALTAAAALGRFELQVCASCGTVQYPPREACHRCLSVQLDWTLQSGDGELISETTLAHSHEEFFRKRLPWRIGLVRLECGPTVVVHVHGDVAPAPARVRVTARLDRSGQVALIAIPTQELSRMAEDKQLREMTCDPRSRSVLVTDAKTATGQALVRAALAAGAVAVWAGHSGERERGDGLDELQNFAQVTLVPLDITCSASVEQTAAEIGGRIDILINNAELHQVDRPQTVETARVEMDLNYFGLLRLALAFGPRMRGRATDGESTATAWVNVLSVFAHSNYPPLGTFSASKAAAHSLSQCLRAEMQRAGVRVINVFPGPIDDERNQSLSLPKLSPEALARATVKALQDGVEDVYPGDVAQEWLARWRENPKVLERELAEGL
ncbi:MAG TPA: SDR family NAD(P)-dependent oxidoreductase [Steroidobacteraceae bacterium]